MPHPGDDDDKDSQNVNEMPIESHNSADDAISKHMALRGQRGGPAGRLAKGTDGRMRFGSLGALAAGVVVMLVVTVVVTQGLTAGLFSHSVRVPGIVDSGANARGGTLAISLVDQGKPNSRARVEQRPPIRVAAVRDLADVQQEAEQAEAEARSISVQSAANSDNFLPPDAQRSDIFAGPRGGPGNNAIITVPSGEGRLLTFDEPIESAFIADTTIADIKVVSPELVYVYGKRLGHTNLLATSTEGGREDSDTDTKTKLTGSALLRIVSNPGPLADAKRTYAPEAPVRFELFGRRTVATGKVRDVGEAVKIDALARTFSDPGMPPMNATELEGPNQVNIRVRFAEVSRSDLKSFGIDWNVSLSAGNFSFGLQKSGGAAPAGNGNLGLGVSAGNFDIDLLIEALKANGALTVLAEPNLTAVTGETANFLAGGEVPIPVPTGDNGQGITVQFKTFGVSLSFTPTLIKRNRIALRVKPEVSTIAAQTNFGVQGFNLPSFTVRRADTVVEMASGQTFALAGLFQREISRNVDKIPVLGDVPVLGPLFRSERYQRNETELVILITPYLVNPVSDREMATPLDIKQEPRYVRNDLPAPRPWAVENADDRKAPPETPPEDANSYGFILK